MEDKEKALVDIIKDLYKQECKKSTRYLIINYILAGLLFLVSVVCSMLIFELSSYETVTVTETTTAESYSNSIEGDNSNANIVNGNQYNGSATHNEN